MPTSPHCAAASRARTSASQSRTTCTCTGPEAAGRIIRNRPSAPLERTPGAGFWYNNGDYILLGQIVEQVEQEAFGSVLTRRILRPLAMADSGPLNQHAIVPALASAYFTRDDASGALSNDLPVYDEN